MTLKIFFGCFVLVLTQTHHGFCQSTNVTAELSSTCPVVTVVCSSNNVPSRNLVWHFDNSEFAIYTLRTSDNFPITVTSENETFNDLVGGVNIQILSASANEDNRGIASFLSTMTANFSALQQAQISEISCGTFMLRSTLEVIYNPNNVPPMPTNVSVQPQYDTNSVLSQIFVSWNEVVSRDDYCDYLVNYTVTLVEINSDAIVEQRTVTGAGACKNNICSTIILILQPLSNQSLSYTVEVVAINSLGTSSSTHSDLIRNSIEGFFNYSLSFDNCAISIGCYSSISSEVGSCAVKYNQSLANVDSSIPMTGSLNSPFDLPVMESSAKYYFKITYTLGSMSVTQNTTFTPSSGNEGTEGFTLINIILSVIGMIMLGATILMICLCAALSNKVCARVCCLVVTILQLMFLAILLALWIVTFLAIEPQTDICAKSWRSRRNDLVLAAFLLSIFSLLCTVIGAIILLAALYRKRKENIEKRNNSASGKFEKFESEQIIYNGSTNCHQFKKSKDEGGWSIYFSWTCVVCKSFMWNKYCCRACGKFACADCTKKKSYFSDKSKDLTVCNNCFEKCNSKRSYVLYEDSNFYEDNDKKNKVYFYYAIWMIFFYYENALYFFLSGNTSSFKSIKSKDIAWVSQAVHRPDELHCLEIKLRNCNTTYIISLNSLKERDEWISFLKNAALGTTTISADACPNQELLSVHFAETMLTKMPQHSSYTEWSQVFTIWAMNSINFYDTVQQSKPAISITFQEVAQINHQHTESRDVIQVEVKEKQKSFLFKPLVGKNTVNDEFLDKLQRLVRKNTATDAKKEQHYDTTTHHKSNLDPVVSGNSTVGTSDGLHEYSLLEKSLTPPKYSTIDCVKKNASRTAKELLVKIQVNESPV